MLRLKWIGFRICSSSTIFSSRALSICPDTQKSESENPVEVVSAQGLGSSRKAILNRPFVLNALTTSMVAILDGLTMGGGAGISIPGTFRVATNKTVFGAPETHIGFHPDAGASFFLSHLPGSLGEYLALTGERLNGAEMVVAGLATHFSMSTRISSIEERLGTLVTNDPSVLESALDEYSDVVIPNSNSSLRRMDTIDHCFSKETVEEIICALETEAAGQNDEWCRKTIGKLKEASPLSLKIALRSIREGRSQTFHQCLVREYRTTCHVLSKRVSGDFFEGIRARLIDKDFSPKWDPPCLEQVSREVVNQYFLPLGEDDQELELPIKKREAYI
ncbi:small ribosomal subunit protein mS47 isoform X4 [Cryptomeria japonica]|uniref:small ribosomal subunit protein mS47 isoform X4 n=1 Tax=Cryptomeria japonica TaxID=3369 RepID=UPI0027DA292D|nr:small ribosomal subunit protein mS47 isoform X4 [Cryptomeria japonica]